MAGGATLAYAKYDPEFKKSLVTYVPFTEPILDSMDNYTPSALYDGAKKAILGALAGEDKHLPNQSDDIPEPKEYKGI